MSTGTAVDDPLQAALAEAESLMESLGTTDEDETAAAGAFVIGDDEDEEEVEVPIGASSGGGGGGHPLAAQQQQQQSLQQNSYGIPASNGNPLYPATNTPPFQQQQQQQSQNPHPLSHTTMGVAPNNSHPNHTMMNPLMSGNTNMHMHMHMHPGAPTTPFQTAPPPGATPMQQQPPPSGVDSTTAFLQSAGFHPANVDAIRASTTRLASNLASMAQRAAVIATPTHGSIQSPMAPMAPYGATGTTPQHHHHPPPQPPVVPELDADQKTALVREHVGDLIPGERIIMFLSNVVYLSDSSAQLSTTTYPGAWCCVMTYYRLVWFNTAQTATPPERPTGWNPACWPPPTPDRLAMPLAAMDSVTKSVLNSATSTNNTSLLCLTVTSKVAAYAIRFSTAALADTQRALEALHTYAFPGRRNLGYLFAFESKREDVLESIVEEGGRQVVTLEPWKKRFEGVAEFTRQMMGTDGDGEEGSAASTTPAPSGGPWCIWRIANAQYQLCPSYPSILAGPVTLDEAQHPDAVTLVRQCAAFRSEQRLPVLTWCGRVAENPAGSIWRCAQPKVGLQGHRSTADELFLQHILQGARNARNSSSPPPLPLPPAVVSQLTGAADPTPWMASRAHGLKILDLRPRAAAMANRTAGYGYENTSHYTGCSLQFCNIGNIHAVRDAYQKLNTVCSHGAQSDLQFTSAIEDTKWLSLVRLVWAAAWETAWWVHVHQLPVVVHCSHGWDRTSQVGALAQLLLDPYYRTIAGFACLVEKDFMAFGHPFHLRSGHGEQGSATAENEGQNAPIFLQFLDCVYQIVHLYPEAFEYTSAYLVALVDTIYACRFGNFLCDTEREREIAASVRQRTHSVWDHLEEDTTLRNAEFVPASDDERVLLCPLPTLLRQIHVWTDLHCRHAAKPTERWHPVSSS